MSVEIYKPEDCIDEMLHDFKNGKVKGSTTHNAEIDEIWKWRKEEFNIWTGYSNEGKSLFLKQLSLIKAIKDNWKFVFCSPEDYPPKEFYDDMIHTLSGKSTDKDRINYLKDEELYKKYFNMIKDNFIFIYIRPPENTIKNVLREFENYMEKNHVDVFVIDPLIKFSRPKDLSDRDDIYASYTTTLCVDFSRKTNTCVNLVMHQVTPSLGENGLYPKPNMYRVKGGGTWSDGCDNVLYVQRPNYAKDKIDPLVIFGSQKIKKQKLVGVPGDFHMKFDRLTNRYTDMEGYDLFKFE